MTEAEILALISLVSASIPMFKQLWDKIAANSSGTVRPLADILDETDTDLDAVIAAAKKELGITT